MKKSLSHYKQKIPKCIYCDHKINIEEHRLLGLNEEGFKLVLCPFCNKILRVITHVTYTFTSSEYKYKKL